MVKLFISVVLCFIILVNTVYAAQAIQKKVETPPEFAGQDGCYSPDLNMVLPYEKPYYPADGKSCIEYQCKNDGDTYIFTCGVIELKNGEDRIYGDKTLPYPECCDSVVQYLQ